MGRIMGIDVGEKRIGIAISDPMKLTAQGLTVIENEGKNKVLETVDRLIKEYDVELVVIGMPRNMNGTYGPMAEKIKRFANRLKGFNEIKIEFQDERMSTISAEQVLIKGGLSRMKRRNVVDQVAASIILQAYLDGKGV